MGAGPKESGHGTGSGGAALGESVPVLKARGLIREFRGFRAVDGMDLDVAEGSVHALVGPNGAGKTTLFNLLTGFLKPTAGSVLLAGGGELAGRSPEVISHLGVARSFQITSLFAELTPHQHVELALASRTGLGWRFWLSDRRLGRFAGRAGELLDQVGLDDQGTVPAGSLSYGRKRPGGAGPDHHQARPVLLPKRVPHLGLPRGHKPVPNRSPAERAAMTFEEFSEDLAKPPLTPGGREAPDVDEALLAEEVKISCTLAMLLCLDRGHRLAYVLGEIMELDHVTGAEVLGITPAAFRKRLQRARAGITGLMRRRCGLFNEANACRCAARVPGAIKLGRANPQELLFASSLEQTRRFPAVLQEIRRLEEADRAAALYRSHPDVPTQTDLVEFLQELLKVQPQ